MGDVRVRKKENADKHFNRVFDFGGRHSLDTVDKERKNEKAKWPFLSYYVCNIQTKRLNKINSCAGSEQPSVICALKFVGQELQGYAPSVTLIRFFFFSFIRSNCVRFFKYIYFFYAAGNARAGLSNST